MSKNPNTRKPVKRDDPMNGAMKFFLAGCVAELYLLIVRRFYINGNAEQQIAWYDSYLKLFIGAGAAVAVLGLVLSILWKADQKKRVIGWSVLGAGAFLAAASGLVLWNMSTLSLLTVVVPVVMLLSILWSLYDRECAMSLTILGASLILVWVCKRQLTSVQVGTLVKVVAAVYLVALIAVLFLVKGNKLNKLLPANADPLPVYVACVLSAAAIAVALVSATLAYYAMWALAVVVFALAVYYTVKQL